MMEMAEPAHTSVSNSKSKFHQCLAAGIATLGIFSLGNVLAWTSPAFPNMKLGPGHFRNLTSDQKSWIGSTATLGALVGCPIAGFATDMFGRKRTMVFTCIPYVIGWILIAYAQSVAMMCGGRFLTGANPNALTRETSEVFRAPNIAIFLFTLSGMPCLGLCGGIFSLAAPVFISETSESHIRGTLTSAFQLMLVTGILFTYILGAFVSWSSLALISGVIPIATFILLIPIFETPRYLLSQSRDYDAIKSLRWYRGAPPALVETELAEIRQSVEESKKYKTELKNLLKGEILKPLAISLSLMVLEQLSAFNAVIFYSVEIFSAAGTQIDSNLASILVATVQVAATVVSTVLVDKAGRRILLIFSEAVMAASFVALGAFFYVQRTNGGRAPSYLGWLPLSSLIVFIIAFSIGIGPLSWTVMGEILPPNVKGLCGAIATSVVWLSAFLVVQVYEDLIHAIGPDFSFWLFALVSAIGTVTCFLFVPETKGKSLDEIQLLFSKNPLAVVGGTRTH